MTRKYFRMDCTTDGVYYEGYTKGSYWNGWACPYFEKDVADKLLEEIKADGQEKSAYCADTDSYVIVNDYMDEGDCTEEYVGEDIVYHGETLHVYPIGSYSWVWDEYTLEEMLNAEGYEEE